MSWWYSNHEFVYLKTQPPASFFQSQFPYHTSKKQRHSFFMKVENEARGEAAGGQ